MCFLFGLFFVLFIWAFYLGFLFGLFWGFLFGLFVLFLLKNVFKSLKHMWISRERGKTKKEEKRRKPKNDGKNAKTALVWRSRRRPVEIGLSHLLTTSQHSVVSFVTVLEYCADWTPIIFPLKFFRSSLSQLMHHQFTFTSNRVRPKSHTHYRVIRCFLGLEGRIDS